MSDLRERAHWWLHGQAVLWEFFFVALRKKHGSGNTIREAWFVARCCQYVAAGQHYGGRYPIRFPTLVYYEEEDEEH